MFSYSIILGLTLEPGVRFLRIFSTSNGPSRVAKPVNVSLDGALGEKYFTSLTFLGSGGKTSTNRIYLFKFNYLFSSMAQKYSIVLYLQRDLHSLTTILVEFNVLIYYFYKYR